VQNRAKYSRKMVADLREIYNSHYSQDRISEKLTHLCNDKLIAHIRDFNLSRKTFSFVDKSEKKAWYSLKDYKELPFWVEFKERLNTQELHYFFPKKERKIQTTNDWFFRQVGGFLRVLKDALGCELFDKVIRYGIRLNEKKYGKSYSDSNTKLHQQLIDMGRNVVFDMFTDSTRYKLREVGFYDNPCYPKNIDNVTIFDYEKYRTEPRQYQIELEF